MALGRTVSGGLRIKRDGGCGGRAVIEEEELGFTTRYPKRLGKKRIVISNDLKTLPLLDSASAEEKKSPLKRQCSRGGMNVGSDISTIESLPQDILGPKADEKPATSGVGAARDAKPVQAVQAEAASSTSKLSTDKYRNYAVVTGVVTAFAALGWYLKGSAKKPKEVRD